MPIDEHKDTSERPETENPETEQRRDEPVRDLEARDPDQVRGGAINRVGAD